MSAQSPQDLANFDALVRAAEQMPFEGWNFESLDGRWQQGHPDWDLRKIVREHLRSVSSFLDVGTGGGEFLATLAPFPRRTFATEGYAPNIPLAKSRLGPLGVKVLSMAPDHRIDLPSRSVELVLCRHEDFDAGEVARVLVPGGWFITQQVASTSYEELHQRFGVAPEPAFNRLDSLGHLAEEVTSAGLGVAAAKESSFPERFLDVGAVVYFLRAAPWEVPGFSSERFRSVLEGIHEEIARCGYWELRAQRFLIVARKPG